MMVKQQARAVARDAGADGDKIQESTRGVVGGEEVKEAWVSSVGAGEGWFSASCAAPADISAKPAEMRSEFYPHCAKSLAEGAWCCDCCTPFKALHLTFPFRTEV